MSLFSLADVKAKDYNSLDKLGIRYLAGGIIENIEIFSTNTAAGGPYTLTTPAPTDRSIIFESGLTTGEPDSSDFANLRVVYWFDTEVSGNYTEVDWVEASATLDTRTFIVVTFHPTVCRTVIHAYADMDTTDTSTTYTSGVDLADTSKALILINGTAGSSQAINAGTPTGMQSPIYGCVAGVVTDANTLTFSRYSQDGTYGARVHFTLVEFY